MGVKVEGQTVGILLYADDIVLMAEYDKFGVYAEHCGGMVLEMETGG